MAETIDKSKELRASVKLVNDRLKFDGIVEGNDPVAIDYIAPLGDGEGYTSLELLLLSLASCLGSSVLTFLRRMHRDIRSCEIEASGTRNETHPTGFKNIMLDIKLTSPDVTGEDMSKVIALSEETYCPVIAMVKGNVAIEIRHSITSM